MSGSEIKLEDSRRLKEDQPEGLPEGPRRVLYRSRGLRIAKIRKVGGKKPNTASQRFSTAVLNILNFNTAVLKFLNFNTAALNSIRLH